MSGTLNKNGGTFIRTANPALNKKTFTSYGYSHKTNVMTIQGTVNKTLIILLFLVLDFDFIETGAETGAPKFMEWYAAFGLMVTLVWLYIEILRLLAKLRSRN